MHQIIYSSSPIHMMYLQYPNVARAKTIMNSTPPNPKSQFCGPTVTTCQSFVIGKLVDLKHEEIATNATKEAATSVRKLAFCLSMFCLPSIYMQEKTYLSTS